MEKQLIFVDDEIFDLVSGYLAVRKKEVEQLSNALLTHDEQFLLRYGHNLKGTGATFCLSELSHFGADLETAVKNGDQMAMQTAISKIVQHLDLVEVKPKAAVQQLS